MMKEKGGQTERKHTSPSLDCAVKKMIPIYAELKNSISPVQTPVNFFCSNAEKKVHCQSWVWEGDMRNSIWREQLHGQ